MQIIESAKGFDFFNNRKNIYVRDLNCTITIRNDEIIFIELENALKPGKTCHYIHVNFKRPIIGEEKPGTYIHFLNKCRPADLYELIELIRHDLPEFYPAEVYVEEYKAIKVFSPFVQVKPIKKPDKWTISHIWKAILAGQITEARQKYYLTDDYRHDADCNFRKGEILTPLEVAIELINSNSKGYYIAENAEASTDAKTVLNLNLYGFDSKELVFYY